MKRKETGRLAPGEVVGRAVYDDTGNILVREGAEVTPALIRVLTRRGVQEVEIKEGEELVNTEDPLDSIPTHRLGDPVVKQKLADMRERLNIAFQHHVGNVTMAVLYKAALDYLTVKIARQPD